MEKKKVYKGTCKPFPFGFFPHTCLLNIQNSTLSIRMNFLSSLLLSLTAATAVLAQDDSNSYADGLLAALRANNLNQLANIVGNNTGLVSALQNGNKTGECF